MKRWKGTRTFVRRAATDGSPAPDIDRSTGPRRAYLVVALGAAGVLVVAGWFLDGVLAPEDLTLVLALAAAGSGGAAALLAVFAARLTADQQAGWVSVALACYGLLAIPTSTIAAFDPAPPAMAVRVLADGLVMGLLVVASVAPPVLSLERVLIVLSIAGAAVLGAAALGTSFPSVVRLVATFVPVALGLALLWVAVGVTIAIRAARRQNHGLRLVGVGIGLLGAIRVVLATDVEWPVDIHAVAASVRLGAVALVLYGALHLARHAIAQFVNQHETLEAELRLAVNRLERTAERDHELRNGLAGLAGATSLVDGSCSDRERLGTAVASELSRLDCLLQAPVGVPPATTATAYAVAPVLRGLVTLRASSGMDVRLEVEPGLHALGSSVTLAQVVTNLLANAERHAPGSPVHITAMRRDQRVTVHVRDFGPGLPPGLEDAVLVWGVRDQTRGGLGLGLHVCHRLLAAEDGTITAHSPGSGEPGCLVVVDLPAASTSVRVPRPLAPSGLQSAP